jgi:hypothetical protein
MLQNIHECTVEDLTNKLEKWMVVKMKQRKFKLIKEYPGSLKLGETFKSEMENYWPEYWEEITEEPILVTEDGIELHEGDEFWSVDKRNFKLRKEKAGYKLGDCYFWDFSTKQLAEKWIEENKPKWSDKDVKDMIKFYDKWSKRGLIAPEGVVNLFNTDENCRKKSLDDILNDKEKESSQTE